MLANHVDRWVSSEVWCEHVRYLCRIVIVHADRQMARAT